MNSFLVTFGPVTVHGQTDRQTDGQTDRQKATPKSPPYISTGGLKNKCLYRIITFFKVPKAKYWM